MNINRDKVLRQLQPKSLTSLNNLSKIPLFTYVVLQILLLLTHESWRDEVSPWIQTQNSSWTDIVYRSQLELQSPVFFSVLKLLHFLTNEFWAYRIFLFLLTIGTAFIIKSLCNNSWRCELLIYSNYYIIYEFSAIQRIYTVSLFTLMTFLFCLRRDLSFRRSISSLTKFLLLLLSTISIWTLIISLLILLTLIFYKVIPIFTRYILIYLIVMFSQVLFLLISKDRDWGLNSDTSKNLVNLDNLTLIFTAPIRSVIFIPEPKINGWNSNILLESTIGFGVTIFLAIIFYTFLLLFILRGNYIGILWFLSISFLAILVGLGKQRHLGQIFLLLLTIVFLETFICKSKINFLEIKSRFSTGIFLVLLLFSLVVSSISITRDLRYEFTTARNLYTFIGEGDLLIVQDSGKNTHLPLVLKLNRNAFNLFGARYSRESLLNEISRTIPNDLELSRKFQEVCLSVSPSRVLLFTDMETRRSFQQFRGKLISRSQPAIVDNEGKRELWLLAWKTSEVKKLCSNPSSKEFLSRIKTKAVSYGG